MGWGRFLWALNEMNIPVMSREWHAIKKNRRRRRRRQGISHEALMEGSLDPEAYEELTQMFSVAFDPNGYIHIFHLNHRLEADGPMITVSLGTKNTVAEKRRAPPMAKAVLELREQFFEALKEERANPGFKATHSFESRNAIYALLKEDSGRTFPTGESAGEHPEWWRQLRVLWDGTEQEGPDDELLTRLHWINCLTAALRDRDAAKISALEGINSEWPISKIEQRAYGHLAKAAAGAIGGDGGQIEITAIRPR